MTTPIPSPPLRRAGVVLAALAAVSAVAGPTASAAPTPAPTQPDRVLPAPAWATAQVPSWQRCATGRADATGRALDAAGARCAALQVPLDYARPDGPRVRLEVARIAARDAGAGPHGTLFYNPGGPGVAATDVLPLLAQAVPALSRHDDLIAMDPRFVGRSSPLDCHWPTSVLRGAGAGPRGFARAAAEARSVAARCAPRRAVLPFVSTRNTARDMDVVRTVLGTPRLAYLGSSYGTYLGAVYAQMFPAAVDRMVLDSAVDATRFGPDLQATQGPALAAAMRRWAAWAARHDDRYGLGASTAAVMAQLRRIADATAKRPLRIGTARLDAGMLPSVWFVVTAGDSEARYRAFAADVRVLARAAARARTGSATTTAPTPELAGLLSGSGAPDAGGALSQQNAVLCADRAADRDLADYARAVEGHRTDEPLFGSLIRSVTPCSFWPAAPSEAPTAIANDVPLLMVGATGDPGAPRAGQLATHRALRGSRLITLPGAYRHTVFGGLFAPRDACVDRAVLRYLVGGGALPATDRSCPTVRPPA